MVEFPDSIELKVLYSNSQLSSRAYELCKTLSIENITELGTYISKHTSFVNLRSCSKETNQELLSLNEYFTPYRIQCYHLNANNKEEDIALVQFHFYGILSVRAQNALLKYFDNTFPDRKELVDAFVKNDFNCLKLRNIGAKTALEIQSFIVEVQRIYSHLSKEANTHTSHQTERSNLKPFKKLFD